MKKLAFLFLIFCSMISANILFAQSSADGRKATTEDVDAKKKLDAPVVAEFESSALAREASWDENIAIHVFQDPDDPISGYRYAKGFANGFAMAEKTGGKPMYVTATYEEGATQNGTKVVVYIDGKRWDYKGQDVFTPQDAGMLLPIIMHDYTKQFGTSKLIPTDVTPVFIER